jgi:hypothetical protein
MADIRGSGILLTEGSGRDAPGTLTERADAVLAGLTRAIPVDGAWLFLRDPERRTHAPLAALGETDPLLRYFQTPVAEVELDAVGLNGPGPPLLSSELPMALEELQAWSEYLLPAGFRGGVATGLFASDGRHVGLLCLCTDSPSYPGPFEKEILASIAPVVAAAIDCVPSLVAAAATAYDATAAVTLTRSRATLPVPGMPDHCFLQPGSLALQAVALGLTNRRVRMTFLGPPAPDEPIATLHRVTAQDATDATDAIHDHLAAVVALSPATTVCGLDLFDLKLLGLLAIGWCEPRIAHTFAMTVRAVSDHVDRLAAALGVGDRRLVGVRAMRDGLLIPPMLWLGKN